MKFAHNIWLQNSENHNHILWKFAISWPPLFCDRYRGQLENGSLFPLNLEENLRERDIGAARKWQSFSQL